MFSDIEAFTRRFGNMRPHLRDSGSELAGPAMTGVLAWNEASDDGNVGSANFEIKGL